MAVPCHQCCILVIITQWHPFSLLTPLSYQVITHSLPSSLSTLHPLSFSIRPSLSSVSLPVSIAFSSLHSLLDMSLTVWGTTFSICTQRTLFTAAELNLRITLNKIDIMNEENKSPEHLARQPFGKIPAADFDGVTFYESRAICRILAEAHQAEVELIPRDLHKKALFEQWASLDSNTIAPQFDSLYRELWARPHKKMQTDPEEVNKAKASLDTALTVLNAQLADKEYVLGAFSLVDVFLTPAFQRLVESAEGRAILIKPYPHIAAWSERVAARPAWRQVQENAKEDLAVFVDKLSELNLWRSDTATHTLHTLWIAVSPVH